MNDKGKSMNPTHGGEKAPSTGDRTDHGPSSRDELRNKSMESVMTEHVKGSHLSDD